MNSVSSPRSIERIGFRFVFVYLLLYNSRFILQDLPGIEFLAERYEKLWQGIVPWVGKHVLRLSYDITVFTNGSGDTTYDYVLVLCFAVISAACALAWTLLERNPVDYRRLHQWLRVYVRYSLAVAMIWYGAAKVFQAQFSPPSLDRLLQPFGDASPMGLLWTFMGASRGYNAFTGGAEMLGGFLLVAPRTTLLGSLVCFGVLVNVVMLNLCYDVPVKLYSSHLAAMSLFLAFPDFRRLADLFLFNRRIEPVEHRPLFARKRWNVAAGVLGTGFIVLLSGWALYDSHASSQELNDPSAQSPLRGIWFVEESEVDGQIRPAILTDGERWRRVVFDWPGRMTIQLVNDSRQWFLLDLDMEKKILALGKRDDPKWEAALTFERPEPDTLTLAGEFDGKQVRAKLRRVPEPRFPLKTRGFHWITEYSFNR